MELIKERVRLHVRAAGNGPWLEQAEREAPAKLKAQGLRLIEPLHGGAASIVLLVEDREGQRRVAKIMPPEEHDRQSQALTLMAGKGTPAVISQDKGVLVLQYIPGQPCLDNINLAEAAQLIQGWDRLAPALRPIKEQFAAWLTAARPRPGERPDIHRAVDYAQALLRQLPTGERLLHGDLGYHNLIQGQRLWAIDPTGASGPLEADIACLGFLWPGRNSPRQVQQKIEQLCQALGGDPQVARKYALVRAACGAGFGNNLGEADYVAQSLAAIDHLGN